MTRKHFSVVGLGYGDEGKGSLVDFLANQSVAPIIVRFNGGAQAAHNVVRPDGKHHTFSQLGAGMFNPNALTYLADTVLINPLNYLREAKAFREVSGHETARRVLVDANATIITPWHVEANRMREKARSDNRHGSCGEGIGETVADAISGVKIRAKELTGNSNEIMKALATIRDYKINQIRQELCQDMPDNLTSQNYLELVTALFRTWAQEVRMPSPMSLVKLFAASDRWIFEGAQGVLLDQDYGWHPHTTWSDTTTSHAEQIFKTVASDDTLHTIGVTRAYSTRHGPGPFVSEQQDMDVHEPHNDYNKWQGSFRSGPLDLVALQYALDVQRVDSIALTCVDQVMHLSEIPICTSYEIDGEQISRIKPETRLEGQQRLEHQRHMGEMMFKAKPNYETVSGVDGLIEVIDAIKPVGIVSYGPSYNRKFIAKPDNVPLTYRRPKKKIRVAFDVATATPF